LKKAGAQVVFEEKATGVKRDGREELAKVLHILGRGDTLLVTRLDRLGRSLRDLANIGHEIERAGANLKVLEQPVDTSTSAGRAFFGMLAVFAAFETDIRRERQAEGIVNAKRAGKYRGGLKRIDRDSGSGAQVQRGRPKHHCARAGHLAPAGLPNYRRDS